MVGDCLLPRVRKENVYRVAIGATRWLSRRSHHLQTEILSWARPGSQGRQNAVYECLLDEICVWLCCDGDFVLLQDLHDTFDSRHESD